MASENTQNFAFTTEWLRITLAAINALFAVMVVMENFVVLLVISRKKEMRTKSNTLLASLAVTDFLVGILLDPITVLMLFSTKFRQIIVLNLIRRFFSVVLVGASIGSIVVISYDRYMHLSKLTHYNDCMTKRKVAMSLLAAWTCPIIFPLVRVVTKNEMAHSGAIVVFILVSFILMCACYGFTLSVVKTKQQVAHYDKGRVAKSIKAAKAILLLLTFFLIMVCPIMVYNFVVLCHDVGTPGFIWFQGSTRDDFYVVSMTIVQANSAINPMIYYFRTPGFRTHINKIFTCFSDADRGEGRSRTQYSDSQVKNTIV